MELNTYISALKYALHIKLRDMGSIDIRTIADPDWTGTEFVELNHGIHVYRISLNKSLGQLAAFKALLSSDEQLKASHYFSKQDSDRFIISRAALRMILASYTTISPAAFQFGAGVDQKPFAIGNEQWCFNVSHASDWILIAISTRAVGVDIEFINSGFPFQQIVNEHFNSVEGDYIRALATDLAFYRLWTRKEAFLKATGQGIGDHLKHIPCLNGIHQLDANLRSSERDWKVFSFMLNQDYVCAVASEFEAMSFMEYAC